MWCKRKKKVGADSPHLLQERGKVTAHHEFHDKDHAVRRPKGVEEPYAEGVVDKGHGVPFMNHLSEAR